jgi:hypothetical protein
VRQLEKNHGQLKISENPKISTKRFEAIERNHVFFAENIRKPKNFRQLKKIMFSEKYWKTQKFPP